MHMNLTTTAAATEAAAAMCDVASWLHFHSLKSLAAGGNGITNFCN